jgi:hypothetical protein
MNKFLVYNAQSGHQFGLYDAITEDQAIAEMLLDAGCEDEPHPELKATKLF